MKFSSCKRVLLAEGHEVGCIVGLSVAKGLLAVVAELVSVEFAETMSGTEDTAPATLIPLKVKLSYTIKPSAPSLG